MQKYIQEGNQFLLENYDRAELFTDFLSGIAGERGIPMWAYVVNRGQCISSFGVSDKNGAILEFLPANKAYANVRKSGFRTFVKTNDKLIEAFQDVSTEKTFQSNLSELTITDKTDALEFKVTYTTMCQEKIPALLRKITIKNITDKELDIELLDGLSQILPYGVNDFAIKNMSNLMSAFTDVKKSEHCCLYKHNYSTSDTTKVTKIEGANFYTSVINCDSEKTYVYDNKAVFNGDSEMITASGFANLSYEGIKNLDQKAIFVIPCAFTACKKSLKPDESIIIYSAVGTLKREKDFEDYVDNFKNTQFYEDKFTESQNIIDNIASPMRVSTANKNLDAYFKNSFFDNLLRGGMPIKIGNKSHYIYSRKHGDLEREYNWFNINSTYYSSGSGNFRDVNQNRRNDIFFFPFVKENNIKMFFNLVQLNGYNPLIIETPAYKLNSKAENSLNLSEILIEKLKKEYLIGEIAPLCTEEQLIYILNNSDVIYKAKFGEGYWTDHFTYNLDLIESYLSVYPDKTKELLLCNEYCYYNSDENVLPLSKRLVKDNDGKLKAFGSLTKSHKVSEYLKDDQGNTAKFSLMSKLIGLSLIKVATLDRKFVGIEMEAGKPGWNDAMNGLPALNASNVADAIELYRLICFVVDNIENAESYVLLDIQKKLLDNLALSFSNNFDYNQRLLAKENFYESLENYDSSITVQVSSASVKTMLITAKNKLSSALAECKNDCNGLYPTFIKYELIGNPENIDSIKSNPQYLPLFLESVAKSFKLDIDKSEHLITHINTKKSQLYDKKLKLYKTSVPLKDENPEIGRIMTFHSGLYERESCFLHMHYKYLLGLIEAGLYDQFYSEIENGLVCNFDPKVYKRSIVQNSSFIVSSECDDPNLHGRGFQPRLTGANSEVLSMFIQMFLGRNPFKMIDGKLRFELTPVLNGELFDENNQITFKFLNSVEITYINPSRVNTYDSKITKMTIFKDEEMMEVAGNFLEENLARQVREGQITNIKAYFI